MKDLVYIYDDLYYCDTDLTEELGETYGGNITNLCIKFIENGGVELKTKYYLKNEKDLCFDSIEELITYKLLNNGQAVTLDEVLGTTKPRTHTVSVQLTEEEYQNFLKQNWRIIGKD